MTTGWNTVNLTVHTWRSVWRPVVAPCLPTGRHTDRHVWTRFNGPLRGFNVAIKVKRTTSKFRPFNIRVYFARYYGDMFTNLLKIYTSEATEIQFNKKNPLNLVKTALKQTLYYSIISFRKPFRLVVRNLFNIAYYHAIQSCNNTC